MSVEVNEKADLKPKLPARLSGVQRYPKRFTYLAHFHCIVMEQKWKEAKYWFWKRHKGCYSIQQAKYDSALKLQRPDEAVIWRQADISARYISAKTRTRGDRPLSQTHRKEG